MINIRFTLGIISVIVALLGYIPYFRDIFRGKTKPHAYSWLVWSSLTWIAFTGQILNKGGAGAWVTGFTALVCLTIFFLALKKGEKNITSSDKLSLLGAGFALLLWYVTSDPLFSVILVIIIDALGGFYPTFRKSYNKPQEETIITYFLSGLKFAIALMALQSYSIITYLYPIFLVLINWTFVVMLIIRRRQHKRNISR